VVEGAKLVSVALDAGVSLEAIFAAPEAWSGVGTEAVLRRAYSSGIQVHKLAGGVIERVAGTVTPQAVLGLAPFVDVELEALRRGSLVVVCAGVRDPGNAGTVLRSAEAAGADGVVFCDGSVDLYNPKTVRASAGSLFHLRHVTGGEAVEVLSTIRSWGMSCLAAVARGGRPYTQADLTDRVVLVLGNEASGLGPELGAVIDEEVTIPMAGRAESLNVGMAATLLCFEAARQRSGTAGGSLR
jgi:TrmH family RNA methyltransferase